MRLLASITWQTKDPPPETAKHPACSKTAGFQLKRVWPQLNVMARRRKRLDTKTKWFHPPHGCFGTTQSDGATASKANPAKTNDFAITTNCLRIFTPKIRPAVLKNDATVPICQKQDVNWVVAWPPWNVRPAK